LKIFCNLLNIQNVRVVIRSYLGSIDWFSSDGQDLGVIFLSHCLAFSGTAIVLEFFCRKCERRGYLIVST
jgi:hypothetical protein